MKLSHTSLALAALLSVPPLHAADGDDQTVYAGVVEKITNTYCIQCHTAKKRKGRLIMETHEQLLKGGSSAKDGQMTVEPGKPEESLMYTMLVLPEDDDLHMPPPDKPQPSAKEIEVIKWWIASGAKPDVKIKDAEVPAELKETVAELAAKKVEKPAEEK